MPRTKQMVLAYFNSKSLIYMNYRSQGATVNAKYIVEALGKFMKILKAEAVRDGCQSLVVPQG
jgi:hypothetical protein